MPPALFGSTNGKGICREDAFESKVRHKEFGNNKFFLSNEQDFAIPIRGVYFICDAAASHIKYTPLIWFSRINSWLSSWLSGYFQCPPSSSWDRETVLFIEWIESVRKDYEFTFGILKQRFRYLIQGIEFYDMLDIDAVARSCCLIHSMLLQLDHLDTSQWEDVN